MRRVASPVDWLFAPDWLTVQQACELSGWDPAGLLEIVAQGGVDVDAAGLIEKRSLYEFQETLAGALRREDGAMSNYAIPLMGLESPTGIVHIAGDPLLCGSPVGDISEWYECDGVPLRCACQRCLRMYLANLRLFTLEAEQMAMEGI